MTYNGGTYAVMMGTPQNLRDFAVGFSLSEGIVQSADDIRSLDIVHLDDGIELRMWLEPVAGGAAERAAAPYRGPDRLRHLRHRFDRRSDSPGRDRRARPARFRRNRSWRRCRAIAAAADDQYRNPRGARRGVLDARAAASSRLREDVGRHNALDKLAGALAQGKIAASEGMVLLTSRVSVEMVQKTAAMGAPLMVAVSAPTALAVRMADAAGITLAAIARADGFEIFTHPDANCRRGRRRRSRPHVA